MLVSWARLQYCVAFYGINCIVFHHIVSWFVVLRCLVICRDAYAVLSPGNLELCESRYASEMPELNVILSVYYIICV